ncbi:nucleotidyltransferase family protein [Arthrobacter sp. zg-Y1219]|uniref:nucleotidyltransferase family protein n=1 Tax=Arthrobacter sp. zg-Y1219 TaxID=3049067 RepID=UPI0024C339D1|nr:nucleotidyltransferase family protein [Arthrobacter sp. zg-Y1219]MDK1359837.1 nucleotidyltransferase family protein [Arthrobacter sp. zg-Y1219]
MPSPVAAVVLAAGAGTRLGLGNKALLPFCGRPLIETIIAQLHDGGCTRLTVVLGFEAEQVLAKIRLGPAAAVTNPDWESGMGSSFRCGVQAAAADCPEVPILVALADQPGLTAAAVAGLIAQHRPGRITAAGYRVAGSAPGADSLRRAHPVLFDAALALEAARGAEGDAGARAFLSANPGRVDVVDCSDLGDGRDVDAPADLPLLEAAPDPLWQLRFRNR